VGRPVALLPVALDDVRVASLGRVWVLPGVPARPPLAQQVPALVEGQSDSLQALLVVVGGGAVRFPLPELVLLSDEALDRAVDLLIVQAPLSRQRRLRRLDLAGNEPAVEIGANDRSDSLHHPFSTVQHERLAYAELAVERRAQGKRADEPLHFEHHVVREVTRHTLLPSGRGARGNILACELPRESHVENGSQNVPHLVTETSANIERHAGFDVGPVSVMPTQKTRPVPGSARLLNRELSWLDFNARLLELASDDKIPLLERVKFCSIFSSNLDEFFMVRVAGLMGQAATGLAVRSPDGRTPLAALAEIRARVRELSTAHAHLWTHDLMPALAENGIRVGRVAACDEDDLAELERLFEREIYPVLTPLAVGPGQPFPYISGLSLSLAVFVRDRKTGEERFARVNVPEGLPRFLAVGPESWVALEDAMSHFLYRLFPQMEIGECAAFRVTRNADFDVSDEADDLLEAVEFELRRRRFGEVVRLEVSDSMSDRMLARLRAGLGSTPELEVRLEGLLDLADISELAALDRPELREEPWVPRPHPRFAAAENDGVFSEIARGDILVHHPYDSFATSFETVVRAAADDPNVTAIKTTVYRTSDDSPLVPALIQSAEAGKQSVCLVELKARFDEHRNIEWSRALERAGVHVVYGFPDMKIHAKMTLIVRREGGRLRRYVHLGTGNYHALTARVYEDFGLFTADEDVAADVADLFNYITGFGRPQRFRKLLVAPFDLRSRLIQEIRKVGEAAAGGKTGRIRIKVNALTDPALIEELYAASDKGAVVEIVARSISSLRPGMEGLSEHISVRSVLGRFLEHSRVFIFQAGKKTSYWIGSPDLMPRNLDHRLEVVAPVEDAALQRRLSRTFDQLCGANAKAWELRPDGSWERLRPRKDEAEEDAQEALMRRVRRAHPRVRAPLR
jgi:polyphosphate kinase